MKPLLHLMAKDWRSSRGTLISCWVCLAAIIVWPPFERMSELPAFINIVPVLILLYGVLLMPTLLQGWIHLDHPLESGAFLHTRPVSPVLRWLPKILLWTLAVLIPALVSVLLQMLFYRLDLRGEDYLRVALKTAIGCLGCFGAVAVISVLTRHHRLATILGMAALLLLAIYESAYSAPAAAPGLVPPPWFELLQSRRFMACNMSGLTGFAFAAWILARTPSWRPLIPVFLVTGLLGTGMWFLWPINLIHRAPLPVLPETARLRELQAQTKINAGGILHDHAGGYLSDPIIINAPQGTPEWPRVTAFVSEATQEKWTATSGPHLARVYFQDALKRNHRDIPVPEAQLIRTLGLPQDLAIGLNAHNHGFSPAVFATANLRLNIATRLADDTRVPLAGAVLCDWYRSVIIGSVPLRPGESFTHDGHSVRITAASMEGGQLRLRLRLASHASTTLTSINFDLEPEFHLCVVNPVRDEIGLKGSTLTQQTLSLMCMSEAWVEATYSILGLKQPESLPGAAWLEDARLFILQRRVLGQTRTECRGEFIVKNQLRVSAP